MKKTVLFASILLAGCNTLIERKEIDLGGGQIGVYVTGKLAGDGQEGVFKDVFIDGKPVKDLSVYHGGSSLWGQSFQGAVAGAMMGGGMAGQGALLRPDRFFETNNTDLSNAQGNQTQGQVQAQGQAMKQTQEQSVQTKVKTNTSVSQDVTNKNRVNQNNTNNNSNSNSNNNRSTKVKNIGGTSGNGSKEFNGCESAGKSYQNNPHCK